MNWRLDRPKVMEPRTLIFLTAVASSWDRFDILRLLLAHVALVGAVDILVEDLLLATESKKLHVKAAPVRSIGDEGGTLLWVNIMPSP